MNQWAIVIPLVSLIVLMAGHIVGMARWSGKVDTVLAQILTQPAQWSNELTSTAVALRLEIASQVAAIRVQIEAIQAEIKVLREARHETDGTVMRHEGSLREMEKLLTKLESKVDHLIDKGSGPVDSTRKS